MPKKVQRPAKWWREPLTRAQLEQIAPENREAAIERARAIAVERVKNDIRQLRKFATGFDASDGYSLNTRELIRLPAARQRKLFKNADILRRATSRPFVAVSPRTPAQRKNLKTDFGQLLPGQKKFIYHTPSPATTEVHFRNGKPEVVSKVKGGELFERIYYFHRRPKSWDDLIDLTERLLPSMPRNGRFKIYTAQLGAVGDTMTHDQIIAHLNEFFFQYDNRFSETILGYQWFGDSFDTARSRLKRKKTMEERFKERREYDRKMRERRTLERLGKAKPCRKCRRKKCVCPPPKF